jgi:DNA-directed RNA polymerase subunit E'/Rpb7
MESVAFFEKKLSLIPQEFNEVKSNSMDDILLKKAKETMENKCSEQGFVLPGSIILHSRSMGYFEAARFTGDAVYYVKLQGNVIYPVDGIRVTGQVIRKNQMGLYVNYQDAIRIQVPRDLHLGNEVFDNVQVGDTVQVELKRSKFAINDLYILSSGVFIDVIDSSAPPKAVEEDEKQAEAPEKTEGGGNEDEDEDEAEEEEADDEDEDEEAEEDEEDEDEEAEDEEAEDEDDS